MSDHFDRRRFLKLTAAAASSATLGGMLLPHEGIARPSAPAKTIRLGFVGVGGRGSYHLDSALGLEGVEVPAIAEIREDRPLRAKQWVEESGRPSPKLYRDEAGFRRMAEELELDAVICSTPWKLHAPVCLAAMRNGKHAVSEVPIILTVEEAWELVETYEKTGKWATLALEQVLLESGNGLHLLNMIQQGLLGEIIHAEGGYVHDLRRVKHDPEGEPWRLWDSIHRNGNLYPDHPMNRIMPYMDINRGDRFDFLVSLSSKSGVLNEYAKEYYGPDHPNVTLAMKQGDYNATLIRTVNGKLVTLNFDTNTPHPRDLFRIQGSKGVFLDGTGLEGPKIYVDKVSPKSHQWESADPYLQKHRHPLIEGYKPRERQRLRGHGSGSMTTPLTWHLLIESLRRDVMPYFDVYDSVTSSVISPLSEKSVASKGRSVDVPDFTRGKWKTRPRLTMGEFVPYV